MRYDKVLVRASAGRPFAVAAISLSNSLVYVASLDAISRVEAGQSWPIGVPSEDVFVFDDEAYRALSRAWNSSGGLKREDWRKYALTLYESSQSLAA